MDSIVRFRTLLVLSSLLAAPALARPHTVLSPEQRRALEQVALADARGRLLERLRTLPLANGRSLGDWAAAESARDRALRLWVREQPRQGRARVYSDAVCEADVHVTGAEVRDALMRVVQQIEDADLQDGDIARAARSWPDVWATGRATLPDDSASRKPLGWENVLQVGLELARRSALDDASQALLEAAAELKVPPDRRLRGFIESSDAVRASLQTAIERAANVTVEFDPDHVVLAHATLPLRDLLRILTQVYQEHGQGSTYALADFRAMLLSADRQTLEAVGFGTPDAQYIVKRNDVLKELDAPTWASESLTASGQFRRDGATEATDDALRDAARLDAIDRLSARVRELEIRKGLTIGAFLAYHQDLKADVALWLSGARPVRTIGTDDGVTVQVELPARRLWEILRSEMQRREVD